MNEPNTVNPRLAIQRAKAQQARLRQEKLSRELARRHVRHLLPRVVPEFVGGKHIDVMCDVAEGIERSIINRTTELNRVIVTMPPRHMKSKMFACAFPLWFSARNPYHEVLVGACNQDLADEHGTWVKGQVDNPEFKEVFPEFKVRQDSKAKDRMINQKGGGLRFIGRGGLMTGRGASLIVIDDPFKDTEETRSETIRNTVWKWFTAVAMTRLAPGGAIVVMHTRWHEDDLIGRILERTPDRYKLINFPALAEDDEYYPLGELDATTGKPKLFRRKGEPLHPARFDTSWYDELRETLDTEEWQALYQQNPAPDEGIVFKREWLRWYKPGEVDHNLLANYLSCDLAIGEKKRNDYTVLAPFGSAANGGMYFYPDILRARLNAKAIVEAVIDTAIRYGVMAVIIENEKITMSIRPLLEDEMRRRGRFFRLITPTPRKDKEARSAPLQGRMQQGLVFFPTTRMYQETVVSEFLAFPAGRHDDVVDAMSVGAQELSNLVRAGKAKPQHEQQDEEPAHLKNQGRPKQKDSASILCAWQQHERGEGYSNTLGAM